jgi:hypothetical protein
MPAAPASHESIGAFTEVPRKAEQEVSRRPPREAALRAD